MMEGGVWWPLLLSTLSGLSTTLGAVLAISRTPDEATLAFLLGTAIGVMATVSGAELWWHKAAQQQNWAGITMAVVAGAACFAVIDPLLPKPPEPQQLLLEDNEDDNMQEPHAALASSNGDSEVRVATGVKRQQFAHRQPTSISHQHSNSRPGSVNVARQSAGLQLQHGNTQSPLVTNGELQLLIPQRSAVSCSGHEHAVDSEGHMQPHHNETSSVKLGGLTDSLAVLRAHHAGLMRLGLLMAVTMSLHNLPEGCAVAFSAFTDVGVMMAVAIAVHNIPEGLIIAVPIYAATSSKARAIGLAAASGLTEPLGALIALFVLRPFVTSLERLDYVLAFVGGVMLAVCGLELWPEARKCKQDVRMMQGLLLGSAVMGWTLYVGV